MNLNCCFQRKERSEWERYDKNSNNTSMPHVTLMMKTFQIGTAAHTILSCINDYIDARLVFGSDDAFLHQEGSLCQEKECMILRDRLKNRRNATVEEVMGMSRVEVKSTVRHVLLHAHFQRMNFI